MTQSAGTPTTAATRPPSFSPSMSSPRRVMPAPGVGTGVGPGIGGALSSPARYSLRRIVSASRCSVVFTSALLVSLSPVSIATIRWMSVSSSASSVEAEIGSGAKRNGLSAGSLP